MVIDAPAPEPQQRFFVKLAMGVLPMLGRGAHFARVQSRPRTVVMKHGGQRNVLPTLVYPDDACLRAQTSYVKRDHQRTRCNVPWPIFGGSCELQQGTREC